MLDGYDGMDLPVVGQLELVGVSFAINLFDYEGACTSLTEYCMLLTGNLEPVMKFDEGPQ